MTPDGLAGGLETLELLSGIVFGADETTAALPRGDGDPLAALERALIPGLESPPCGVAFSGGRDSSAVLAVASEVARRHGLPEPVPITLRFPGVEHTEETAYQESVVRHVGASDWERLEPGGALDVLGDVATGLTLRHGSLYPGNIHFLVPMLDRVGGGTLLTGLGGDEILSGNEHHAVAAMLAGRRRPTRTALRLVAKRYVAPHRDRGTLAGQLTEHFRWMRPETRAELVGRVLEDETRDRVSAAKQLRRGAYRFRYLHRARADLGRVAADRGVAVDHPLLDAGFVAGLADRVGFVGLPSRTAMMQRFFRGLLPEDVLARTTKARFDDIFWTTETTRVAGALPLEEFAEFIDVPALLDLWASDRPKGNTFLLAKYLMALSRITESPSWVDRPIEG